MNEEVITNSFTETQTFATELAKNLSGGTVLGLHGDLGSGKTTFVQGLAKGLGIEKKILSPTFIMMRSYQLEGKGQGAKGKAFYHVDLYRTESAHDIEGLGLLELLGNPETIVAIEWPEKMGSALPEKRIDLFFEYLDETQRKIIVSDLRN